MTLHDAEDFSILNSSRVEEPWHEHVHEHVADIVEFTRRYDYSVLRFLPVAAAARDPRFEG